MTINAAQLPFLGLKFPHIGQAFAIERHSINKKSGVEKSETVYGITSRTVEEDDAQKVLETNRGHWCIEIVAIMS